MPGIGWTHEFESVLSYLFAAVVVLPYYLLFRRAYEPDVEERRAWECIARINAVFRRAIYQLGIFAMRIVGICASDCGAASQRRLTIGANISTGRGAMFYEE